jgi:glycosyltransferase involved in cell wall biosynthesis
MNARPVIAIQQGARRNYIYARQLEAAGLLNYLACDAAWSSRRAEWLSRLAPRLAGRLHRRSVNDVPRERICATVWPVLIASLRRFVDDEIVFDLMDKALAWRLRLRGLGGATIIVNYFGNGGPFLDYAKRRGAKVITDFISSPQLREIERCERATWPGWDGKVTSQRAIDAYRRRFIWLLAISDIYLCPSQTVADDLAELPGFDPARVRIVPYGSGGGARTEPQPEIGRVLFAGSGSVCKGLPYLAQAASVLRQQRSEINIFVAGDVSAAVCQRAETRDLNFLGRLSREDMVREFARADLFCFPSLSEGSASVAYEALAHGLPVITTRASGSVVRDGIDGLIIPARDPGAIAAAICAIISDRHRRNAMSRAAMAGAAMYNEMRCGAAFLDVVRETIASTKPSHEDKK